MHCCTDCTNLHFGQSIAKRDINNYLTTGAKKSTKALLGILKLLDLQGLHLLDIGAGIGIVSYELSEYGLAEITYNDISTSYSDVFKREFGTRLGGIKVNTLLGDLVEVSENINNVDIAVLDKTICCYPHYRELVKTAADKASMWYAYVIPRDTWWVKLIHRLGELRKSLKGDRFKSYIYPVRDIENIVLQLGFEKYIQIYQREWLVAVYKKQV